MSKFGVFQGASNRAMQVFEAHEMLRDREFVNFLDKEGALVATVNLGPGQSVRKMTAADISQAENEHSSGMSRRSQTEPGVWG